MSVKCILTEQGGTGGGSAVELYSIDITTPPDKTAYVSGESFDSTGMVVTATYAMGGIPFAQSEVGGYTVSPLTLTDGVTEVTISYAEGSKAVTTTQKVSVRAGIRSIAVTTKPTKTSYEYGDTLNTSGMVVTGTYSDGTSKTVTGWSVSPTSLTTVGTQTITVTYVEDEITRTTTFTVTVERKSVSIPSQSGTLTYTGGTLTPSWSNYNTTYMTIGGTTSAVNAGTYNATFTLKSNYRWSDSTTDDKTISWTIDKAAGSLSLSTTAVDINASNYSTGVTVTVTRSGDGTISYSPTSVTGLTLSRSGNVITVKGNGSTAVSTTITVSVAEGTNYKAPTSKTFTVSAVYWSFGAGAGETADASWFAGLKSYLASNKGSSIKLSDNSTGIVGATKTIYLSETVLGATSTTAISLTVIGVDQDGDNTVTFQTTNCLPTTTVFGSSQSWQSSTAKTQCETFLDKSPMKGYVKTLNKGTCLSYSSSSRNGTVKYNDATCWLPSELEVNLDTYSAISKANSSTTKAECTYGYMACYSYYNSGNSSTDTTRRIKKLGSSGSAQWWWLRGAYYDLSTGVCVVYSSGGAGYGNYYSNAGGLAPAFAIG